MSPITAPGVVVIYHRPVYKITSRPFADASAHREHIHAFAGHSRFPIWEINADLGFPRGLADLRPGVLLLHYSLFGSGRYLLGEEMHEFVSRSDAFKIAFFQDEYLWCSKRFDFVNEANIDLVYTHVRPQDIPQVWGRFTPRATARFNYPGYVDKALLEAARLHALPETERDIDVGYRGRPLPPVMGSGALEKSVIGERFKELARETGLSVDIDIEERARLYGTAWYRFLGRSKAVLGVESGTSYLDLEDEVLRDYEARVEDGRPVTLEALREGPLGQWDHNFSYRTIGPRHLEAAAFHVCQVLFEGEYSGVLEPMVHYLPLKKDFSNFEEVVDWLADQGLREEIAENAHRDLIRSGQYTYKRFVHAVDEELIAAGIDPAISAHQRAQLDAALRRGRVRRRVRAEARYLKSSASGALGVLLAQRPRLFHGRHAQ